MRTSVERVNSRLKDILGLRRITLRGILKVTVESLLSLLSMAATAIGMSQRNRLKEVRSLVDNRVDPKTDLGTNSARSTMPPNRVKAIFADL